MGEIDSRLPTLEPSSPSWSVCLQKWQVLEGKRPEAVEVTSYKGVVNGGIMMVRVYISGRIWAASDEDIQANIRLADEAGRQLAALGYNAFIPHKQTDGWQATTDLTRDQYLALGLEWLELCHVIYLLPGWEQSNAGVLEYEHARRRGIPAVRSIEELEQLFPAPGRPGPLEIVALWREPQMIYD